MPEAKRQRERLLAVFVLGVLLLNYPLLSLVSTERLLLGVPVLYLALFAIWLTLIVCMALALRKTSPKSMPGKPPNRDLAG
ncbi:MAG: hypothetical protein BWK76_22885 [Desulfobulbaceae bacterium A2]|nr:MAG: hypothetical protein BWK76_22885 [Desulfobulbaceae bacterium A2]